MNKKATMIVFILIGVLTGGIFAFSSNQNAKTEQEKMAAERKTEEAAIQDKEETTPENEKKSTMNDASISERGSYVTLADYNLNPSKYSTSKQVYFFHASWCPICQSIDKKISADITKIPAGVTLIKTDFDSNTELRKKYGVTTQYTFVQVDENGNEIKQWSASSLSKAIDGIEL